MCLMPYYYAPNCLTFTDNSVVEGFFFRALKVLILGYPQLQGGA